MSNPFRYGRPRRVVTDGLSAYSAAMREVGNADRREVGHRLKNRRRILITRFDDEREPCAGFEI
jgi:transposase-like protein